VTGRGAADGAAPGAGAARSPGGGRGVDAALLRELSRDLAGRVSASLEDRICYSLDATDLRALPDAVAWPVSTEEAAAVVRAAARRGVPVVPRGAGTGYTGGCLPVDGGIVVSTERMRRVLAVDAARRVAVVEPGVVNAAVGEAVAQVGLSYPPDPASLKVSTIGGNVAEGAGGPRTVLHGTTRDYVVGLEAVLADGSVVRTGCLSSDGRSGWDPAPLLVGSEGTLAVVTAVALRLTDRGAGYATFWAEFASLDDAALAVADLTAAGLPVGVLELLDAGTLACALEHATGAVPENVPEAALLVELEGDAGVLAGAAAAVRAAAERRGATAFREAATARERDELWDLRRSVSPSLARHSGGKINEDIAVPRSAIPAFVKEMRLIGSSLDLAILAFGHAGDGNLHVNVMVDRSDPGEMARAREAVSRLFDSALALGGTLSGEHGIGITKAEHLARELGETAMRVTRSVKRALDPTGLLNPDKVVTERRNPWWDGLPPDDARRPADGPGRAGGATATERTRCS
jgi:glycolate oxidase